MFSTQPNYQGMESMDPTSVGSIKNVTQRTDVMMDRQVQACGCLQWWFLQYGYLLINLFKEMYFLEINLGSER